MKNKNDLIINKKGNGAPVVLIVGSVHGDEVVGKKVIERLKKVSIKRGTLITLVANPKALAKNKRYLDSDLNRVFPGKINGDREEKIASKIFTLLQKVEYVLDIHSTETNTKDLVIIKKNNKNIKNLIRLIQPKRVLLMSEKVGQGSLINHHLAAVSLELGRHGSQYVIKQSWQMVMTVLARLEMTNFKNLCTNKTDYFKLIGKQDKPKDFKMNKVNNFSLIHKGDVLGYVGKTSIKATSDFFPALFSQNSYPDIMGFKCKKVNKL